MEQGIDINKLLHEAKSRWLKAVEVFYILQNYERLKITQKTPVRPPSGSWFLFNRRVLRYFRNDGYQWRKKANGKTIREGHERLKVGGNEALNCYYAHGEQNPMFQRRSYWMLHPAYEHIAFVHYREVTEGRCISDQAVSNSTDSNPTLQRNVTVSDDQIHGFHSQVIEVNEQWPNSSLGSGEEVTSDQSISMHVIQALRTLEEQLSLDKDKYNNNDKSEKIFIATEESPELALARDSPLHDLLDEFEHSTDGNEEQAQLEYMLNGSDESRWCNESPSSLLYASTIASCEENSYPAILGSDTVPVIENGIYLTSDFSDMWLHQDQPVAAGEANTNLASAPEDWFSMWEFSPEWAFTSESTKIIVTGDYICNPSEQQWSILFGDVEVPLEMVRNGVFRCMTPHHSVGKVKVCVTSGKNRPYIEIGEFEFCEKLEAPGSCRPLQVNEGKSIEELLLLVTLVKMLLCANANASVPEVIRLESDISMKYKESEDMYALITEALLAGNTTAIQTLDLLVQELLKDKLHQVSKNMKTIEMNSTLTNKEQSIIHLISGLGYQWALELILCAGIGINFRDSKGWTALHWAAKYGREEMVAALLVAGASPGAVTHPTPDNSTGKTAAVIASENGHEGLAGYLSEAEITSHFTALRTGKSISQQHYVSVEDDKGVDSISNRTAHLWGGTEDQLSIRDTLAGVRNTTQAAARIQAAFRAYSFNKKQERAAASQWNSDLSLDNINEPPVAKLRNTSHSYHDLNSYKAAVSIQKNYRCWHRRKEYLDLRRNAVKIQTHWRAHLARKKFEILRLVSVLEKVVLRWHRKGDGLRGFQAEPETTDADNTDEDILKVFRKQKVDAAIDNAVSRVLSMINSPKAREQYRRMLLKYQHAEAEYSRDWEQEL